MQALDLPKRKKPKEPKTGFLYFIREIPFEGKGRWEDPFVCKIGFSKNVPRFRMSHLQTGNPRELAMVGWLEVENYDVMERALHKRLQDPTLFSTREKNIYHIRGEWYYLTMDSIGALRDDLGSTLYIRE